MELQLEAQAVSLQSIYEASMDELEHEARALAYTMASDPEIANILGEADHVLRGRADADDVRAVQLRAALTAKLDRQWQDLNRMFDLRQLQFLLTPDLRSFLRFHARERYGDSLIDIGPMLRSIQSDLIPRSGFEIGRTFAGIRGGAAIIRRHTDGSPPMIDAQRSSEQGEYVGTLEVGIGVDGLLRRLSEKLDIGIAVLLNSERVTSSMWSVYQPSPPPDRGTCCFLLSASRPEASGWLAASLIGRGKPKAESWLQAWEGKRFQLIRFPLIDFLGKQDPRSPQAGTILIWRDAAPTLAAHRAARSDTVRNALVGYAVVQLIVLLLLNLSRREWKRQLDLQTAAVTRLSRQNALLLNTAGEGIYGVGPDGVTSFINPAALAMLGYSAEHAVGRNQHHLFHHHHADGSPYPDASCPIFQTLRDGKRRSCEDTFIRADGTFFPVALTVSPI
ncbi:MAG: PAS domain-containing protein, partial [Azoarcus sp.]|nr:PAS domain-containing protein [Azoarcus sp.]